MERSNDNPRSLDLGGRDYLRREGPPAQQQNFLPVVGHTNVAGRRPIAGRVNVAGDGVQEWSKGDIYPAVISRTETYLEFPSFDAWYADLRLGREVLSGRHYERERDAFYAQPLSERFDYAAYTLHLDGVSEVYACYDDAYAAARGIMADPAARARWVSES